MLIIENFEIIMLELTFSNDVTYGLSEYHYIGYKGALINIINY